MIITYFIIGVILACLTYTKDDRRVITQPDLAVFTIVLWPAIVWYMVTHVKSLKWKGKVIWTKKQ